MRRFIYQLAEQRGGNMKYKFTHITDQLIKKHGWLRVPLYRSEAKNVKTNKSNIVRFNFNKLHISTEN